MNPWSKVILLTLIISHFLMQGLTLNIKYWKLRKYDNYNGFKSIDTAVTEYFEKNTYMLSIAVYLDFSNNWQSYILDFLTEALKETECMKYEIFIKSNKQIIDWHVQFSYYNLWYVDSYESFRLFLTQVQNDANDNMGKYFIIMNPAKYLNQTHEIQLILEKSFEMNIVDIVVAVYVKRNTFKLYSYEIFHPQYCRQVVTEQVNLFENGKFKTKELFPYKFSNFHGCPIVTYIRNASLFFTFNLTADGTEIESIQGVEANMLQTMAEKLNFTLKMYYSSDKSNGQVYENGTALGPFNYLNENKIDVLLGFYHYPVRTRYFGESASYAFMPLVMVISEHKTHEFKDVWITKPYTSITWLTLLLTMMLVIVLVELAHNFLGRAVTWIDIFGLVLGNSRPLRVRSYTMKYSFATCIFGIMILCGTFQGRLYNAFNSVSLHKETFIDDLIRENYTFLLRTTFNGDLIRSLKIPSQQIIFRDVFDDYIIYEEMRKYPKSVATLTNYWDFQMFIVDQKHYDDFDLVPMVVILNQICAYMRHHSYLIDPLNRLIYSLRYSGLLNKWLDELKSADKTNEPGSMTKYQLKTTPKPMTLDHFKVVFIALSALYIVSFIILMIELLLGKRKEISQSYFKIKLRLKLKLRQ